MPVMEHEKLPIAAAKAGDSEAWDAIFQRYQLPLYTYIYQLIHDEQTSFDIVQEVFVAAVRHMGQLREERKFGSWLFGIAHQKCLQEWRRQSRFHKHFDDVTPAVPETLPDPTQDPHEQLVDQEQERRFMQVVEELPEAQRSAVLLHFIEDFSLEEIAEITGTGVGTVKSRIYYGKKALRQRLKEREL